jgi:hypothetical protein
LEMTLTLCRVGKDGDDVRIVGFERWIDFEVCREDVG